MRGRREVPPDGEVSLYAGNGNAKAQAVLLGSYHHSLDGSTPEKGHEQPEAVERIALWAIELSEFDIQYRPRTVIKGQVVADFIAKYTQLEGKGAEILRQWSIHTNGSLNRHTGGTGVVI